MCWRSHSLPLNRVPWRWHWCSCRRWRRGSRCRRDTTTSWDFASRTSSKSESCTSLLFLLQGLPQKVSPVPPYCFCFKDFLKKWVLYLPTVFASRTSSKSESCTSLLFLFQGLPQKVSPVPPYCFCFKDFLKKWVLYLPTVFASRTSSKSESCTSLLFLLQGLPQKVSPVPPYCFCFKDFLKKWVLYLPAVFRLLALVDSTFLLAAAIIGSTTGLQKRSAKPTISPWCSEGGMSVATQTTQIISRHVFLVATYNAVNTDSVRLVKC